MNNDAKGEKVSPYILKSFPLYINMCGSMFFETICFYL